MHFKKACNMNLNYSPCCDSCWKPHYLGHVATWLPLPLELTFEAMLWSLEQNARQAVCAFHCSIYGVLRVTAASHRRTVFHSREDVWTVDISNNFKYLGLISMGFCINNLLKHLQKKKKKKSCRCVIYFDTSNKWNWYTKIFTWMQKILFPSFQIK